MLFAIFSIDERSLINKGDQFGRTPLVRTVSVIVNCKWLD